MSHAAMETDKKPAIVKKPDVLKKFNAESLLMIERGLLGDLPEKLKPQPFISRARPDDLQIAKPSSFLSSCLPVTESPSPVSDRVPFEYGDENISPLKKSFSFREKLTRMSFFGKDKEKKWKIGDDEKDIQIRSDLKRGSRIDDKSHKRFWFNRHKENSNKPRTPIYQRSKSFEFLPKAIEEEEEVNSKKLNRQSSIYEESMGDAWTSNDSLEYISNVYYDKQDGVFLKSIREFPSESSSLTNNNSSISTVTSASSIQGNAVENIFKTTSVMNLLDEFDKAVDLFSESYLSDCEPYTKSSKEIPKAEKRKSFSFSNIPSPKVLHVTKVDEISEDFKQELSRVLSVKRRIPEGGRGPRRGSVTDWFVLEDQASENRRVSETKSSGEVKSEMNRYRRGQQKPMNRVRRMSSTKYWITPEECAVYSREQRPPLVIPRITNYRAPRQRPPLQMYPDDSVSSMRNYDRLGNWSPTSEKSRVEIERSFGKDGERLGNNRLGGSTENLLIATARRPHHLQLPASSSGDSLDVEIREGRGEKPGNLRSRKVRSMVHRRSPVPAPRVMLPNVDGLEGPVKRTKFFEGGKKSKKNWTDGYMILTPTALYFYKDYKSYIKRVERGPGTPPSPTAPQPEMVLPLKNARIDHCIPMHTRRHTRSLVLTWNNDQYLIQDETEEGARRWFSAIRTQIAKLSAYPQMLDSPYQSSNTDLESLGRTPPAARHQNRNKRAGGSSNEDLSDSTEVSKSHVRSRLRKFFAKRPAMEVLVKKGIYKDEPVFGRNLEEVCPSTIPRVPEFVVACVTEIEREQENMCTDGLYRASGNLSQVQKIRLEIDQNNMNVIQNNTDIHVLTGSLKLFFRELKEPLIPCSFFDRILAACSIKPKEAKIKEFRDIIAALPQCNRDTLKYLLEHLIRVTKYSERNRMHTANLAIVFGPTLLWAPAEQAHNIAVDCIQQNNVVDILLTEFKDIFVEDNTKGKKKA